MEKKYDGTIQSLANKSRQRHKHKGLAQIYRKSIEAEYKQSYKSMYKQIKKFKNYEKPKYTSYPKSKYEPLKGIYPGEYVKV